MLVAKTATSHEAAALQLQRSSDVRAPIAAGSSTAAAEQLSVTAPPRVDTPGVEPKSDQLPFWAQAEGQNARRTKARRCCDGPELPLRVLLDGTKAFAGDAVHRRQLRGVPGAALDARGGMGGCQRGTRCGDVTGTVKVIALAALVRLTAPGPAGMCIPRAGAGPQIPVA
jgi:hypothetical protein